MKRLFYIFRHGETNYNVERKMQGCLDIPLNETGIAQAHNLAKQLSDVHFDKIYSSPLSRALNTAKIIAADKNIEIVIDKGLSERNMGVFCGKIVHIVDVPADTPINVNADIVNVPEALIRDDNYVPDNGESNNMFAKRVCDTMVKIAKNTDANIIGISSHGGVVKTMIKQFSEFKHGGVPNVGYIVMQWDGKTFSLINTPEWLMAQNVLNEKQKGT